MDSNKIIDRIILFIIICLIAIVLFKDCGGNVPSSTIPNHDSIYKAEQKIDSTIAKATRKDSILIVNKIKYIIRYKTVYDSLYITDTLCQQSLITLYNAFGDLNNANDSIIANKDTVIKALVYKVNLKQSHITIDSTYIVRLKDSIPKARRRSFAKGLFKGFIAGAIIVESANIGAIFLK